MPSAFNQASDFVGAVLGARKHQRAFGVLTKQRDEQGVLFVLRTQIDLLLGACGGGSRPNDFDPDRLVQVTRGELGDLPRHRRREQECLALARHLREDSIELLTKAHVEHAVGFVEDQHFYVLQAGAAVVHVVQEATGCGDDDIVWSAQRRLLRTHAYATNDGDAADVAGLAKDLQLLGDLLHELARRREDKSARRGAAWAGVKIFDQRQDEGRRFAGTGGRAADDVLAFEGRRNRAQLDGRWRSVTDLIKDG